LFLINYKQTPDYQYLSNSYFEQYFVASEDKIDSVEIMLSNIDYLVLHSNMISDSEFNKMVDKYISREKIDNTYIGFFNTKTVYKVK
jgi:hypothetical protein